MLLEEIQRKGQNKHCLVIYLGCCCNLRNDWLKSKEAVQEITNQVQVHLTVLNWSRSFVDGHWKLCRSRAVWIEVISIGITPNCRVSPQ